MTSAIIWLVPRSCFNSNPASFRLHTFSILPGASKSCPFPLAELVISRISAAPTFCATMASKRAVQSLGIRANATLIGRQTSACGFHASRALRVGVRSQNYTTAGSGCTSRIGRVAQWDVARGQRRWISRASDEQSSKVYDFDSVCSFFFLSLLN